MTIHRLNRLNNDSTSQAIERLSSGLRINRAADDAAGLSISESFISQVRGTHQAMRNAQDGISMLRTAEGAFSTIHDVLQRMRELSVQGANGTYSSADRLAMQQEMEELKRQIDMTAYFTSFNNKTLLVDPDKVYNLGVLSYTYQSTGTAAGVWAPGTNVPADTLLTAPGMSLNGVTYEELQAAKAQLPYILDGAMRKAEGTLMNSGLNHTTVSGGSGLPLNVSFVIDPVNASRYHLSNADNLVVNLYSFFGTGATPNMTFQQAVGEAMGNTLMQREDKTDAASGDQDYDRFIAVTGSYDILRYFASTATGDTYLSYGKPSGAFDFEDLSGADSGRAQGAWFYRYMLENHGLGAVNEIAAMIVDDNTETKTNVVAKLENYLLGLTGFDNGSGALDKAALEAAVGTWITSHPDAPASGPVAFTGDGISNTVTTTAQKLDQATTLQIGANAGETLDVDLFGGALGNLDFVGLVNVMDSTTAGRSIATIDKAIAIVSDARARLGASENRLEATLNRLANYAENTSAARSRLRDTDVASEMANLTRSQVMAQASIGTLSTFHSLWSERIGALLDSAS
jgi:flagellin